MSPACPAGLLSLAVVLLMGDAPSPVKSDEVVVFFPTFGHLDKDSLTWVVPVHGWIFEPVKESLRRRLALRLLRRSLDLDEADERIATFRQRARAFLVDNESGKKIPIRLGERHVVLDESDARGHFTGRLQMPTAEAKQLLEAQMSGQGWLSYQADTRPGDDRTFQGRVQFVPETGLSVISDIDDTIKVSEVASKRALLANTFLREYRAVDGMAEVYRSWAASGAVFHYVSASPWQLYEFLAEFLDRAQYPAGTFHLKTFRWKDSSFFSLFAAPEAYKPGAIRPILETFPRRHFVLVGDSGEKDPEIYAELARKYPKQIVRILIRDVTGEKAGGQRYQACFEGVPPSRWHVFTDPMEIKDLVLKRAD
jgi:phosphatidate phosphatase APP1